MAEPKTRPTAASVTAYIDALPDARMRADCRQLLQLMSRITGEKPVLWGASIVGFGRYHYVYASGNSGDWPLTGFAPRAKDLTLYVMDGFDRRAAALEALGPHKTGKSCLYLKSLAEVDLGVLEAMLADSVQTLRARYPAGAEAAPATAAKKAPTRKTAIRQGAATTLAAGKPAAKQSTANKATGSARAKRR